MTRRARVQLSCGPLQTTWTYRAPVDAASDEASAACGANIAVTNVNYER